MACISFKKVHKKVQPRSSSLCVCVPSEIKIPNLMNPCVNLHAVRTKPIEAMLLDIALRTMH